MSSVDDVRQYLFYKHARSLDRILPALAALKQTYTCMDASTFGIAGASQSSRIGVGKGGIWMETIVDDFAVGSAKVLINSSCKRPTQDCASSTS